MSLGVYGILILFGLFILLLVINPKLSCFGKKLQSPFYPLFRKKKQKSRNIKTQDYGFDLGGKKHKKKLPDNIKDSSSKKVKTRDYGFDLGGGSRKNKNE